MEDGRKKNKKGEQGQPAGSFTDREGQGGVHQGVCGRALDGGGGRTGRYKQNKLSKPVDSSNPRVTCLTMRIWVLVIARDRDDHLDPSVHFGGQSQGHRDLVGPIGERQSKQSHDF
jgi:hypothetical protein